MCHFPFLLLHVSDLASAPQIPPIDPFRMTNPPLWPSDMWRMGRLNKGEASHYGTAPRYCIQAKRQHGTVTVKSHIWSPKPLSFLFCRFVHRNSVAQIHSFLHFPLPTRQDVILDPLALSILTVTSNSLSRPPSCPALQLLPIHCRDT